MQGTVNKVNYNGKAYSAEVSGQWYGAGFKEPEFKAGDVIEFEVEQRGKFQNLKDAKVIGSSEGSSGGGQGTAPAPAAKGQSFADRDVSIAYQSSRKDALQLVQILVQQDCLSLPAKKSEKADAVKALVEDYTAQFFIRLKQAVEEGGVELEDSMPSFE